MNTVFEWTVALSLFTIAWTLLGAFFFGWGPKR